MHSVTDLLVANLLDVFGNRDSAARRTKIEEIYTEDVVFTDPEGTTHGRDALQSKAQELLDKVPETFVFTEDGLRYAGPDTGALGWAFGPAGEPVARGIDIITVRDAQIATLVTLFVAG